MNGSAELIKNSWYEPDMHNEIFQSPGKGQQRYYQTPLIRTLNLEAKERDRRLNFLCSLLVLK